MCPIPTAVAPEPGSLRSSTPTDRPAAANSCVQAAPTIPAPMTKTSIEDLSKPRMDTNKREKSRKKKANRRWTQIDADRLTGVGIARIVTPIRIALANDSRNAGDKEWQVQ